MRKICDGICKFEAIVYNLRDLQSYKNFKLGDKLFSCEELSAIASLAIACREITSPDAVMLANMVTRLVRVCVASIAMSVCSSTKRS